MKDRNFCKFKRINTYSEPAKFFDKKGMILGGLFTDFIVIVFVIILLLVFFVLSGFIRAADGSEGGISVSKEGKVGLGGVDYYMKNSYTRIAELRAEVSDGKSVKLILEGQDGK